MNCSVHPTPTHNAVRQKIPATSNGSESMMIGIPNVCVSRFSGC
jgi:hypothetical protein